MSDKDRTSRLLDELLPCPEAPADLGERVLAASAGRPRRAWRWRRWLVAFGAGLAIAVVSLSLLVRREPLGGRVRAWERQTLRVGSRAVAVIEPDGEIAWRIQKGRVRIDQRRGDVFYRVSSGGPLAVAAPAGEVVVTGTCFRVALKGAASYVQVLEGAVALRNRAGEAALAAGDWGVLWPGLPPRRLPALPSFGDEPER